MKIFFRSKFCIFLTISIMLSILPVIITVMGDPVSTTVSITPMSQTVGPGDIFTVSVYCVPGQPIKAFEFKLSFNAALVQANEVTEGDIFNGYSTFFNAGTINNSAGTILNIYGLILGPGNVSDPGFLVDISFTAESTPGTSNLDLYDVGVTDEIGYIPISLDNGTVLIDVIPPVVVHNSPSQGYTGDLYTFNASVTDNTNVADDLLVNVDWSHGDLSGNESMLHVGDNYFEKTVTLDLNSNLDMTYSIYARDSYDNSITTSLESISVADNDPPVFTNVYASPYPQEIFGFVNISAEITDNIEMDTVYLNIIYPDSSSENLSITGNKTGDTYYCNRTYNMIGTYSYYLWANDEDNNNDVSAGYIFVIGDMTSPEISNIALSSSTPLDTDPTFGWVNITCDVTDNVAVEDVTLNITIPNGSWNNVSLNTGSGTGYYINSSTVFSQAGNYSYHIRADDPSDNTVVSSSYTFSMVPNWDINNNGVVNLYDLVVVSNHYDETGNAGWIREDVDNNGEIQVFDLVLVSNHYGEIWWEV